jgi:hypothetical protein
MNPQYEYIASAVSFAGKIDNPKYTLSTASDWVSRLNGLHNHYVSALYNAYTEPGYGTRQYNEFRGFHQHYGDSGGLQMVSLNIGKITDDAKEKIYEQQGRYSDVAMIFDEIPVFVPDQIDKNVLKQNGISAKYNTRSLKNTDSRVFDPDIFVACAKETARNILNQINYFDKIESNTKIIIVLQGNNTEWYQKWLNIILKNIPFEKWNRLGGIAFGSPAYGAGMLEDIEKLFFISQIQAPKHLTKHFHLLGVGAMNRMIPVALFRRNGVIPEDVLISYDSSKHTGGLVRGQYQIGHKIVAVPRDSKKHLSKIENKIFTFAKEILGVELPHEDLHNVMFLTVPEFMSRYPNQPELEVTQNLINLRFTMLFNSIYEFIKTFDKLHTDEKYLHSITNNNILLLEKVKTAQEFAEWEHLVRGKISSKRTPCKGINNSLEEFFA